MQRILLVVIVLYVVWRVLFAWGRRLQKGSSGAEDFSRFSARRGGSMGHDEPDAGLAGGQLVACELCGTCVPAERSLSTADGRKCCSRECCARLDAGEEREPG